MLETMKCGFAADLWALGVIIFQMFAGFVPFKGKTQNQTFELIKKGIFEFPNDMPHVVQDIVSKLLVLKPEDRLGAYDLNDLKCHKFFDGIDFRTIED